MDKTLKKHILITGGNGYIGVKLVSFLSKYYLTTVFDRTKPNIVHENVNYICDDLKNIGLYQEILNQHNVVIHLTSSALPNVFNPYLDCQEDLLSSIILLDSITDNTNIEQFIFVSSGGAVYGYQDTLPITENNSIQPISSYGIVKHTIEQYVLLYAKFKKFTPLILRPGNIYGPGIYTIKNQNVISNFLLKIYHNQAIEIWGKGDASKDYVYIDDLMSAFSIALQKKLHGIYNIGTGNSHTIHQILSIIKPIVQKDFSIQYKESKSTDVLNVILDSTKIKQHTSWCPKTEISQGISYIWYDIVKHFNEGE